MTHLQLDWRHGLGPYPELHAVVAETPIVELPNGQQVRFALCNLATELDPPQGRGWPRCPACQRRLVELSTAPNDKDC